MLKIKDDVDLKELEKFGFIKDKELSNICETVYSVSQGYQTLCIELNSKTMFIREPFTSNAFVFKNNILFDLIQAGLVEKVGEENE